ncbi:GNAT family N-acetyltransferase [Opitutus terrae]|uniref:GCN5-related N-acetyltransferase n=1 Tax=Opitutus terrae (strain DSM 11246 / JCM 15787 / PB90-1) TaxID=452637 RepID=B1ZN07_OPITP|nr:GNAT family N-acetyltransferase [Opitutus terrae]ACB76459.1 hypothetical protein Oter_3179 [Opitutus terrae PB90-1]
MMIPLPTKAYSLALERLRTLPFNTSFAEAVLTGSARGFAYADDPERPAAFVVGIPAGMTLLFGESGNAGFVRAVYDYVTSADGARRRMELLQAWPDAWEHRIRDWMTGRIVSGHEVEAAKLTPAQAMTAHPGKIVEWVRLNYTLDVAQFRSRPRKPLPAMCRIARVGPEGFDVKGSTVPHEFWDSAEEFVRRGIGYAVWRDEQIASLAFSAFVVAGQVEVGIETRSGDRGLGLATHACAALIEHCLAKEIEPLWSCRQGNRGSEATARTLGFVETQQIPYFALPQSTAPAQK